MDGGSDIQDFQDDTHLQYSLLNTELEAREDAKYIASLEKSGREGKPPTILDVSSFQSNSLSILVLFLETETYLLINKPKRLDVIAWISVQIYL